MSIVREGAGVRETGRLSRFKAGQGGTRRANAEVMRGQRGLTQEQRRSNARPGRPDTRPMVAVTQRGALTYATRRRNAEDHAAFWFHQLDTLGELTAFPLGQLGHAPRWIAHARQDATTALRRALVATGHVITRQPHLPHRYRRPSTFAVAAAAARVATAPSAARPPWEGWRPKPQGRLVIPPARAVLALTPEQTERLRHAARTAGGTVTTLALAAMHRAVMGRWLPAHTEALWQVPVNLRSRGEESLAGNRCSFISLPVACSDNPAALRGRLERQLARHAHWGTDALGAALARWAPTVGARFIAAQHRRGTPMFAGAFSNLGAWETRDRRAAGWYFAPTVTQMRPLGVGAVTVDGVLTLAVQLHPCLSGDQAVARELLQAWQEALPAPL